MGRRGRVACHRLRPADPPEGDALGRHEDGDGGQPGRAEGPWVSLNENRRGPVSGSATIPAPTADPPSQMTTLRRTGAADAEFEGMSASRFRCLPVVPGRSATRDLALHRRFVPFPQDPKGYEALDGHRAIRT